MQMRTDQTQSVVNVDIRVSLGVPHADTAAEVENPGGIAVFVAQGNHEGQHQVSRVAERLFVKDLRADMAMEARDLDVIERSCIAEDFLSLIRCDCRAELGVDLTRVDRIKCMRVDTGRDAQKDALSHALFLCICRNAVKFHRVVGGEQTDARVHRITDIGDGLCIAVEADVDRIHTCGQRIVKLTGRDNVDRHALFLCKAVDAAEGQGLGRIQRAGIGREVSLHRAVIGAALLADAILVKQVHRGSVLFGKRNGVRAAQGQMPFFVDR